MSRTAKSIQNSKVALLFAVVSFVIGFFSRKVFLDHLGAELLGLNTTAVNLLQFINIAEMGIGTAIACTLYKPLFDKDQETINEIVSLQGWLYRNIAFIVMGAASVLMCFFPMIFVKSTLPIWYAYATFSVLLFGSLLDYFVNYKQIILSANQEQYKIVYSYSFVRVLARVFQIIAFSCFENEYLWWLAIEFAFIVISAITLNITVRKSAPQLRANIKVDSQLRLKYPEVITKVKQVFVHKIGVFVLTQTQPLIVYAYSSLTVVAYYGNYMFVILGVTQLITSLFNGMAASVGNLVAEGDMKRIIRVFDELYTSRLLLVAILTITTYVMLPQFITLWVGSEYIMSNTTVVLMLVTFFIRGIRLTVDEYINAYGLFRDMWAPLTEAALNISCSVLLGYFYGIDGVLCGAIISLLLIVMCWKPYFLFRCGLKQPLGIYLVIFFKGMFVMLLMITALYLVDLEWLTAIADSRLLNFFISGAITTTAVSTIMLALLYPISQGMRDFVRRVLRLVRK
ncbi:MAG: sugar transporter [Rikenellaceae bacterium]